MLHRTDFGGLLVCCYKAIQQLNGVEKIIFDAKPQFDRTICARIMLETKVKYIRYMRFFSY